MNISFFRYQLRFSLIAVTLLVSANLAAQTTRDRTIVYLGKEAPNANVTVGERTHSASASTDPLPLQDQKTAIQTFTEPRPTQSANRKNKLNQVAKNKASKRKTVSARKQNTKGNAVKKSTLKAQTIKKKSNSASSPNKRKNSFSQSIKRESPAASPGLKLVTHQVQKKQKLFNQPLFTSDKSAQKLIEQIAISRTPTDYTGAVVAFSERYPDDYASDVLLREWLKKIAANDDWQTFERHYSAELGLRDIDLACAAWRYQVLIKKQSIDNELLARQNQISPQSTACNTLIVTLLDQKIWQETDAWLFAQQIQLQGDSTDWAFWLHQLGISPTETRVIRQKPANYLANQRQSTKPTVLFALWQLSRNDYAKALTWLQQSELAPNLRSQAYAVLAVRLSVKGGAQNEVESLWQQVAIDTPLPSFSQEWRLRHHIQSQAWTLVVQLSNSLPDYLAQNLTWRYWHAIALQQLNGDVATIKRLLTTTANDRNFYAELARDALNQTVHPPLTPLSPATGSTTQKWQGITERLFYLSENAPYQRLIEEWRWLTRRLELSEKKDFAAHLCQQTLWDRCIALALETELDWSTRYPAPYRQIVEQAARNHAISPAMLFAIMRQESRFIHHARSPVGATGLMQLLPSTAQQTARRNNLPLSLALKSKKSLLKPEINVPIGAAFIAQLLHQYKQSLPLTAIAYNAGPGRANKWQRPFGSLVELLGFIEAIPFSETRSYTKNVLHNAWVYQHLLDAKKESFTDYLKKFTVPIQPIALK